MATDEPILIKRYANRKLYDQSRSRYVTLEELEELIRQGREIRVVDAVSGEDLTSQTLAQIILDTARSRRIGAARSRSCTRSSSTARPGRRSSRNRSSRASRESRPASGRPSGRCGTGGLGRAGGRPEHEGPPPGPSADAADASGLKAEVAALKEKLKDLESRLGG